MPRREQEKGRKKERKRTDMPEIHTENKSLADKHMLQRNMYCIISNIYTHTNTHNKCVYNNNDTDTVW